MAGEPMASGFPSYLSEQLSRSNKQRDVLDNGQLASIARLSSAAPTVASSLTGLPAAARPGEVRISPAGLLWFGLQGTVVGNPVIARSAAQDPIARALGYSPSGYGGGPSGATASPRYAPQPYSQPLASPASYVPPASTAPTGAARYSAGAYAAPQTYGAQPHPSSAAAGAGTPSSGMGSSAQALVAQAIQARAKAERLAEAAAAGVPANRAAAAMAAAEQQQQQLAKPLQTPPRSPDGALPVLRRVIFDQRQEIRYSELRTAVVIVRRVLGEYMRTAQTTALHRWRAAALGVESVRESGELRRIIHEQQRELAAESRRGAVAKLRATLDLEGLQVCVFVRDPSSIFLFYFVNVGTPRPTHSPYPSSCPLSFS
ncbi:hypothetical protein T492DRAFT_848588 [Pavlovales sp. CCMP2436]|nr:hypothetical protein T492DRAFT_848588 [Pavlovales sp. CCMP2436]